MIARFAVLALFLLRASSALAYEEVDNDLTAKRVHLTVSPELVQVVGTSGAGGSFLGMGLGVGVLYGLTDRWGVSAGARQVFDTSGNFLFTDFDARLTMALTGSLVMQKRSVSVSEKNLYEYEESYRGGFRAQVSAARYLFTTSVAVVPYSGFGASAYYEFPTRTSLNYLAGVRADMAVGNSQTLLIPQLFGGVALCF